jgi:predicted NUDIX family NTP pyrophosphohydrolase
MPKTAAGLLLYRHAPTGLQVLLVHPGGPFWARKDLGTWSIPKGEVAAGEAPLAAALRELEEETGAVPSGPTTPLGHVKQPGGKIVHAWGMEGDFDPSQLKSNLVVLEWPKGSGRMLEFPEVDRAAWFDLAEARRRLLPAQVPLLDVLAAAPQVQVRPR